MGYMCPSIVVELHLPVGMPTAITVDGVDPQMDWLQGPTMMNLDNLVCEGLPHGVGAALEELFCL